MTLVFCVWEIRSKKQSKRKAKLRRKDNNLYKLFKSTFVTYILTSVVLDHTRALGCHTKKPISNEAKVQFEAHNHARVQRLDGVLDLK